MKLHDRAMRRIDDPLPNLGQSRGPWTGGISSKSWVQRNTAARVGLFIIGSIFVIGALCVIASSYLLTAELKASMRSPLIGFLASFFAVMIVLCVACWFLWYGSRLLMSSFRRSSVRKE
jgi:VIT1/CCC1 family predicted Fe2+/Mn2+ transporter